MPLAWLACSMVLHWTSKRPDESLTMRKLCANSVQTLWLCKINQPGRFVPTFSHQSMRRSAHAHMPKRPTHTVSCALKRSLQNPWALTTFVTSYPKVPKPTATPVAVQYQ
jgi:hypothetical protein